MRSVPSRNSASQDWHPADIKCALAKKGYTFARIAREYGFVSNAPNSVLQKPWARMQRIVADLIGAEPWEIWPSRYDDKHKPLRTRTRVAKRHH